MKIELFLILGTIFFITDTMHDGKYTNQLKSYKKYAKVAGIVFAAFSMYLFIKKNPNESRSLIGHLNGMVRYMPLDKQSRDLITPFLDNNVAPIREQRIMQSGNDSTSRSVSGTKKKYVASNQDWNCGNCNNQLNAWYEVDHKIRLEHGGSNEVQNLVALCRECHGQKTAMENM